MHSIHAEEHTICCNIAVDFIMALKASCSAALAQNLLLKVFFSIRIYQFTEIKLFENSAAIKQDA